MPKIDIFPPVAIFILVFVTVLVWAQEAVAQPDAAGEVMFVAYNADGDRGLAFVTLVDIPASTTIFFRDDEWNGSAIGGGGAFVDSNEGSLTWQNNTGSAINAGTVITLTDVDNSGAVAATAGTVSRSGSFIPGGSTDVIYAYIGTDVDTPTSFLTAIANNDFGSGTLTNTGLTSGTTANALDGINADADVAVYQGATTCNSSVADCAQTIATVNGTNWVAQDASGDQSQDATTPDFPDNVPGNFTGTALPVELIAFEAKLSGNHVVLRWQTASETNNAGFEIHQRRVDESFTKVTFVSGAGTTTEVQSYSYTMDDLEPGVYVFRLKQVDYDGAFEYSSQVEVNIELARSYQLISAYPNPFNPEAQFTLVIQTQQYVKIGIYDVQGRLVDTLHDGLLEAHQPHTFILDGSAWASGVYMYKVTGERFQITRTITLLK